MVLQTLNKTFHSFLHAVEHVQGLAWSALLIAVAIFIGIAVFTALLIAFFRDSDYSYSYADH